jgi:hypothetical protein
VVVASVKPTAGNIYACTSKPGTCRYCNIIPSFPSRWEQAITTKDSTMQALVEAASHIAQEIARTRQHLSNLEQALEGLKPLITVDAATTTLTFAMPEPVQPVEDLSVVNTAATGKRKRKPKAADQRQPNEAKIAQTKLDKTQAAKARAAQTAPIVAEVVKLPATGAELWLKCMGRRKVTVAQIAEAALSKLKLGDTAKSVMSARAKTWVYAAVKRGILLQAGTRDGSKLFQLAPVQKQSPVEAAQTAEPVEATPDVDAAPVQEGGKAV